MSINIMKTDGIICVCPLHKFLILDSAWSIRILMSSLKYFQILKLMRLSELTFCWLESSFFVRHMTHRQLETHHWRLFSCNDFQCNLLIFWSLVHKFYNYISLMNFHGETYSLIFWKLIFALSQVSMSQNWSKSFFALIIASLSCMLNYRGYPMIWVIPYEKLFRTLQLIDELVLHSHIVAVVFHVRMHHGEPFEGPRCKLLLLLNSMRKTEEHFDTYVQISYRDIWSLQNQEWYYFSR